MNTHTLLQQADALERQGQREAARQMLMTIVAAEPSHYHALMRLGAVLLRSDLRRAARMTFDEVLRHHPGDVAARVALGHMAREEEDWSLACAHYQEALQQDPDCRPAHQALSYVLSEMGDEDAARGHRERGFADHAIYPMAGGGKAPEIRVLLLVSAIGGNIPTDGWFDAECFGGWVLVVEYWDGTALPPHDLVVNAIGDADRARGALVRAEAIAVASGKPVINEPSRVAHTGRADIMQRLARIPHLIRPQIRLVDRNDRGNWPEVRYPVLVRAVGYHTGRHFVAVATAQELDQAVGTMPGHRLWLIERLPTQHADGTFRKLRVLVVGGQLFPVHYAVADQWKVHHYTARPGNPSDAVREEAFLTNMAAFLGQTAIEQLAAIADTLGLDYAGIDFDLTPDGRVMVFEANATMVVPRLAREAQRPAGQRAVQEILAALRHRLVTVARPCGPRQEPGCSRP